MKARDVTESLEEAAIAKKCVKKFTGHTGGCNVCFCPNRSFTIVSGPRRQM